MESTHTSLVEALQALKALLLSILFSAISMACSKVHFTLLLWMGRLMMTFLISGLLNIIEDPSMLLHGPPDKRTYLCTSCRNAHHFHLYNLMSFKLETACWTTSICSHLSSVSKNLCSRHKELVQLLSTSQLTFLVDLSCQSFDFQR